MIPNPVDFSGRVAVVTGGSGVLGGAIARALGEAGATVWIVGRSRPEAAEAAAKAIRDAGGKAEAAQADVLDRAALEALAARLLARHGRLDFLVNAAGGARKEATTAPDRSFFDLPEEAVRQVFDLNWLGTFLPCQVFGKIMADRQSGAILNLSSYGALHPLTRSVAYSAGKAAVTNFTQWLAVHLAQTYSPRLRVNALVPGFFLTEQNRFLLTEEATGQLTERGRRIVSHTPAGRFGEPSDLTGPALWLLSDAAGFVNGATLSVDGGLSAFGGI
jgi:NAD(P)-dependent dehydrogenase (short-subunit alcohol dehydrogenase family)